MSHSLELFLTILASVLASSGFWAVIQRRLDSKDAKTRMLIGLGHDRLIYQGMKFINRGWITKDELEDYLMYLYEPYHDMGGNGTGESIVERVKKLPIRSSSSEPPISDPVE